MLIRGLTTEQIQNILWLFEIKDIYKPGQIARLTGIKNHQVIYWTIVDHGYLPNPFPHRKKPPATYYNSKYYLNDKNERVNRGKSYKDYLLEEKQRTKHGYLYK